MRAVVVLLGLAGGCGLDMPADTSFGGDKGGNGSGSGGADASARGLFDATVEPLVSTACSTCHVGEETTPTNMFLGRSFTADSFYDGIINDRAVDGGFNPGAASLLTKGTHEGPAWSGTDAQTISTWLEAEGEARGSTASIGSDNSSEPDATERGAEAQWAACLSVSQADYDTTQAFLIATMTSDAGACSGCHQPGGAGGAYLDAADSFHTMLAKWQQEVFLPTAFVVTPERGGATFHIDVATTKICGKGTEKAAGTGDHPAFDCQQALPGGTLALPALEQFRVAVQTRLDAGTCPAPAFAPPQ